MRARDNPFAVGRFDGLRYRFSPGDSMETLIDRLRERGMRGALVGPEGRGKSTLLGELACRLENDGFSVLRLALRRGQSRLPATLAGMTSRLDSRSAFLLDGAEQLSTIAWLRLRFDTRKVGILVITSHRGGLLPTLLHCETSPGLLGDLLDELDPRRPSGFPSPEALWHRHDGDLRRALFDAYDIRALDT